MGFAPPEIRKKVIPIVRKGPRGRAKRENVGTVAGWRVGRGRQSGKPQSGNVGTFFVGGEIQNSVRTLSVTRR